MTLLKKKKTSGNCVLALFSVTVVISVFLLRDNEVLDAPNRHFVSLVHLLVAWWPLKNFQEVIRQLQKTGVLFEAPLLIEG